MRSVLPSRSSSILLFPIFLFLLPNLAQAQGVAEIKAAYTKYEYRIPMRDGTKLFTAVYVPKDQSQTYPILLTRTPYSVKPYGADQYPDLLRPSPLFVKAGYIFVLPGRARPLDVGRRIRQHAAAADVKKRS